MRPSPSMRRRDGSSSSVAGPELRVRARRHLGTESRAHACLAPDRPGRRGSAGPGRRHGHVRPGARPAVRPRGIRLARRLRRGASRVGTRSRRRGPWTELAPAESVRVHYVGPVVLPPATSGCACFAPASRTSRRIRRTCSCSIRGTAARGRANRSPGPPSQPGRGRRSACSTPTCRRSSTWVRRERGDRTVRPSANTSMSGRSPWAARARRGPGSTSPCPGTISKSAHRWRTTRCAAGPRLEPLPRGHRLVPPRGPDRMDRSPWGVPRRADADGRGRRLRSDQRRPVGLRRRRGRGRVRGPVAGEPGGARRRTGCGGSPMARARPRARTPPRSSTRGGAAW